MREGRDGDRDDWLRADDAALLGQCAVDTYRASGPGGQKRNKTSSAVRLRHRPSGVMVIAEESRSQHENKARALRRLRLALALEVRRPVNETSVELQRLREVFASGRPALSTRHGDYPLLLAGGLDVLAACEGKVSDAAALLGTTTGQLSAWLTADEKRIAAANRIRQAAGHRPLA